MEQYGKLIVASGVDKARLTYVASELFDNGIIEQDKDKVRVLLGFIEKDLEDAQLTADCKDEAWLFGLID